VANDDSGCRCIAPAPASANMTSVTAVALFGGACLSDRRLAFLVPFSRTFSQRPRTRIPRSMALVYGCFALIVLHRSVVCNSAVSALTIAGAALASSVLFFVVTNFGVWALDNMIPGHSQD